MKGRWIKGLLTLTSLAGIGVVMLFVLRPWEPYYQFRPLSFWVDQCIAGEIRASSTWLDTRRACPEKAAAAIRAIGPKAVPILLRKIHTPPLYPRVYPILPIELQCRLPQPDSGFLVRNRAVHAISLLGHAAVPNLVRFLTDANSDVRQVVLRSLAFMGVDADSAAVAVSKLLKDPDERIRMAALGALRAMGANRRRAIPALVEALQDSANSVDVLAAVAAVLGAIGADAQVAAVELNDILTDPNSDARAREQAAVALCRIKGDTNAMAFLLEKLENCRKNWSKDPNAVSRWGLVEPARQLAADDENEPVENTMPPARLVGIFVTHSSDGFDTCLRVVNALGEMGPLAEPAVATLLDLIRQPNFHPSVKVLEPRLLKAAREALAKIDPEAASKLQ
jgi:HEAT repeat protein